MKDEFLLIFEELLLTQELMNNLRVCRILSVNEAIDILFTVIVFLPRQFRNQALNLALFDKFGWPIQEVPCHLLVGNIRVTDPEPVQLIYVFIRGVLGTRVSLILSISG